MWKKHSGLSNKTKQEHMHQLAEYRRSLWEHPKLRLLFIELTGACNEHCLHCGSHCGDFPVEDLLSTQEIKGFLDHIRENFPLDELQLCVTGGEPLLRKDFFEIMAYAKQLGFHWGMTSNGTLITREIATQLLETGMLTVSISVDGLKETHDWFRQSQGSYEKTMEGIRHLLEVGGFKHVQITTVVHHKNIHELEDLYREFLTLGIRSWRIVNIEPIGRALEQQDLMLSKHELKKMLKFINEKRFQNQMEVTYGCSHYLGVKLERELRKWYFLCNAGIYAASISYKGDIGACLDIPRLPELIQGNIRRDSFARVWKEEFKIYRENRPTCQRCSQCKEYEFCNGDSFHTWDFQEGKPGLCLRELI